MKALLEKIRKILRDRRTRKFLTRLVSGVAAVVVFITTYALVLPAITMESQAACGIEAHQHDDSCYTEELICGQEESEGHHHTEDCYTVTKDLVCSLEEHQHSAENGCYDEDGNLICKLEEHTHTDSCYEEHRELTCGLEETDGHTHTDSCYKKVLVCGKQVHTHSAECYKADPELQSAAVAPTGMTSAAATSDYSVEEYAQEESHDASIGSQAFDEPEETGSEDQNPGEETIDEGSSSAETEDNQDANQDADIKDENADKEISDEGISQAETENDPVADLENNPATDLENENADDNSVAAESDDMTRNDDSESKDEKDEKADAFETGDTALEESADEENLNTENEDNNKDDDREGEESASSFSTGFAAEEDEDSFIPEKEALDFNTVLNNKTGIYYHHLEAGETVEDSSAITDWTRVDEDTELSPEDLIRVYLGYTLPADAINATNDIARYRLPDTLHLTDEQIDAINKCENGISSQYVDYSKLEITDIERHAAYLGLESVEGTRTPDEELKEDSQEFISATVKAEKVYDEDDKYEGTDLIFTFSPYTVEKNAHAYDKEGQPTKAGEKVSGWLMLDFNLGQVDFEDPVITRTAFETSEAESADGFNEDNDHIEDDPAEDDSVEEKNNTENNTVETEDTEDNTDGESGEEADNGQNSPAAIERSERTAEVVFVEDGWDEKGDQIDKISTTLRVVEETVIEAEDVDALEDEDALEDGAAENTAEKAVEDTGEAATEDAASAVTEDAASAATEETADPSVNGTTAEEVAKDPVDADQVIMPAMSFNDSIKISTGRPAGIDKGTEGTLAEAAGSLPEEAEVFVRVEADEGTFPAGTTMVLSAVDQSSIDTLAETLAETVESGDPSAADTSGSDTDDRKEDTDHTEDKEAGQNEGQNNSNTRTYGFQAVDITFLDKDGNEIEPAKPVRVALTSAAVEQAREKVEDSPIADPVVVHVDNEGNAEQMDLVNPQEVEPAKGRSEEELLEEAEKAAEPDKTDKAEIDDDSNTAATEIPADDADGENDDTDAGNGTTGQSADNASNTGIENSVVSTDDAPDTAVDNNDAAVDDASDLAADNNSEASDDASDPAMENIGESADDTSDFAVDNNAADTVEEDVSIGNENADASEESATADGTAQVNTTAEEDGESADTAEFTADSFSVYAIVYTVELYTNVITDSGETYRITVTYDETSGIPQSAELKVKEIKEGEEGYEKYYMEAVKAAYDSSDVNIDEINNANNDVNPEESANENSSKNAATDEADSAEKPVSEKAHRPGKADKTYARFFDIEIWSDGRKIEPTGDVSVSIRLLDVPETDDRNVIKIVHFNKDDIEIIPHNADKDGTESADTAVDRNNKQTDHVSNSAMEFNFTASSFSVYSVVSYTVDFYWEVNGKLYEFSLPGGGFVSLKQLIEVLGIAKTPDSKDKPDEQEGVVDTEETETDIKKADESVEAETGAAAENDSEGADAPENNISANINNGTDNGGEESIVYDNAMEDRPLTLEDVVVSDETRRFVSDVDMVEFSSPKLVWVGKADEASTVGRLKEANELEVQYSAELTVDQIKKINDTEVESGDWAIISMLPFESEEALTVTMRTGEVFTIRVTDAVSDAPMKPNGTVQTISNPSGTTIDLFDYWVDDTLKDRTGQAAWPGFHTSWAGNYFDDTYIRYGNNDGVTLSGGGDNIGINSRTGDFHGHALKFTPAQAGTVVDGTLNNWKQKSIDSAAVDDPDDLTGGLNSWTHNATPRQGIVENVLNSQGYPKLTTNGSLGTNGEDLNYLFDHNAHAGKEYMGEVNQLLYVDPNGFYTYESHDFSATYNENNPNNKKDGTFTLSPWTGTPSNEQRGFWPFGSEKYWVGVHMQTKFSMPKEGRVLNPRGEYKDMVFEFKGDDDTWLYVDGILVGDGGGIHNQTQISLNFRGGTVTLSGKHDYQPDYRSDYEETLYLYDIYDTAGKAGNYQWVQAKDANGNPKVYPSGHSKAGQPVLTFADSSEHTFDMFYLERGGGMSNLYIHYNLVSTTEFSAHKAYTNLQSTGGRLNRDDFQFELVGYDGAYDADGQLITNKENQTAVMPSKGSPSGDGTAANPKKVHYNATSEQPGYTSLLIGVTEDGNVNFGDIELEDAVWASRLGETYRYMVREIPGNLNTIYDDKIYYFTGTVVYEDGKYKLKKTRYLDEDYTTPDPDTTFNNFVNGLSPLTLKVVKKYKPNGQTEVTLPGAQFSLTRAAMQSFDLDSNGKVINCKWTAKEGETPLTGTTSSDGTLNFNTLKEGYYILEETAAPAGYQKGSTYKWLVKLQKQESDGIIKLLPTFIGLNEDGSEVANSSDTLTVNNNTSTYEILNTPHEPIQISVEKKWQNADMSVPEDVNDYSATFTLKRLKTEITTTIQTTPGENATLRIGYYRTNGFNGYRYYENKTYQFAAGSTATVSYDYNNQHNNGYNSYNWRRYRVVLDDGTIVKRKDGNNDDIGDSGTIEVTMPANGRTVNVYFWDNWIWQDYGSAFTSLSATGSQAQPTQEISQTVSEETEDLGFSEEITINGNNTGQFENTHDNVGSSYDFPIIKEEGNKTYIYKYYIEETSTNKPDNSGNYEAIYIINGKEMSETDYLAHKTDDFLQDGGTQTIINRKVIDIPVEKRWPDYEQSRYKWEAVLHMDYREVPLNGSTPSSWAEYRLNQDDYDDYTITLGTTQGHTTSGTFANLPMYCVSNDGKACRREYSVVEKSYTVWENDTIVASFDGTTYYPDENHKYALWYQHDAGEDDNYGDASYPGENDYNIMVYNMHENRTTQKDIELDIHKAWEDADGNVIENIPDNYKATFVLRRNVLVEYRNYEGIVDGPDAIPRDEWVWVKLDTGYGSGQILQVPPGRHMFIRGNLKPGADPEDIIFIDPASNQFTGSKDEDPRFVNYNLFKVEFDAPSDYTVYTQTTPYIVSLSAGADKVAGGLDGFFLSDSSDRQNIGVDQTFRKEFELSNENGWIKHLPEDLPAPDPDDPQASFEHDHQLPAIEVSILDSDGNTANTYIYTYFFEEVKCTPDTFYATFTDSNGNLTGDSKHLIYTDETITATNRPVGFTILKVDEKKPDIKLPGATFTLRKLDGNPPAPAIGGTFGTDTSMSFNPVETAQGSGTAAFAGLKSGYYEVKETVPPEGYILTEPLIFYIQVKEFGDITLLNKVVDQSTGSITWEEVPDSEPIGKVSFTSKKTADGKIITFTVNNEPGAELPHTGGPGTGMFTILGTVLLAFAGIVLIRRRRII